MDVSEEKCCKTMFTVVYSLDFLRIYNFDLVTGEN